MTFSIECSIQKQGTFVMPTLAPDEIKQNVPHLSEETPLHGVKSDLVVQRHKLIHDIAFASLFGLTAGLILGCSFGFHSGRKDRWMISVIPLAFAFNPFRLYPGTGKSKRIARTTALSLSCLAGLATNLKPEHIVSWLNWSVKLPFINFNTMIFIVQLVWAGTNIYSASRLRDLEPEPSQIQITDYIIEKVLLDYDKKADSSIAMRIFSCFLTIDEMRRPKYSSEEGQQYIKEETTRLREKNQRSYEIFSLLIIFVQGDAELKKAYNKALSESAGKLLPDYVESQTAAEDKDIQMWSKEARNADYWEGQVTRVRHFLYMNDEFSELLASKFLASDLANKEELLEYFGYIVK